jgi:hypothetical protein
MRLRPNPDDAMPSGQVMARIVVHTHGKAREKGYAHLINKIGRASCRERVLRDV